MKKEQNPETAEKRRDNTGLGSEKVKRSLDASGLSRRDQPLPGRASPAARSRARPARAEIPQIKDGISATRERNFPFSFVLLNSSHEPSVLVIAFLAARLH